MKPRPLIVSALALLLAACGSGIEGSWSDDSGLSHYTFGRDGKVVQSTLGIDVEMAYRVDGDQVRLQTPMGAVRMVRLDHDTLAGPMGVRLHRDRRRRR